MACPGVEPRNFAAASAVVPVRPVQTARPNPPGGGRAVPKGCAGCVAAGTAVGIGTVVVVVVGIGVAVEVPDTMLGAILRR
jgi:hypothetical protein